jgi:cell wall-associated NlpC family hydrolase
MTSPRPDRLSSAPADRVHFRLVGPSRQPDARQEAVRPDLVDLTLAGQHFAPHYARAMPRCCVAPSTTVRAAPDPAAPATSQLLHGEAFHVLELRADWAWGYCAHDHYVGYVGAAALGAPVAATHQVTAIAAPLFAAADIKAPVVMTLPGGARVAGTIEGRFLATDAGFVHRRHVAPIDEISEDWASVAERYTGQPYLWGGRGAGGIDCSGLVQQALAACGRAVPRDTDQQRAVVGDDIDAQGPLRRGDLVFFPGHVGIMADGDRLIHGNAHWMSVVTEPLDDVIERLRPDYAEPVLARRRIGA